MVLSSVNQKIGSGLGLTLNADVQDLKMEPKSLLNRAPWLPISSTLSSRSLSRHAGGLVTAGRYQNPLKLSFLKNQPLGRVTATSAQTKDVLAVRVAALPPAEGGLEVTGYPLDKNETA